ncbi:uncharacterized protein C7orf50 homolog [Megalops cyprinoides]|uniref:uncharacterized protein C7orf50 homolog n=1 Tax=Megalops cyprinoides TaxID=118141 RepID=UPI0018653691|nr:uncharacterized protein C7orf50 homolog [Megalops cyprinoides]XP_036391873.1 uncharacterized protein C7orf50 homolog [Megalops cyprinoides]XP_036391882.1 uncharacterized protein C7orf50 homolog [Megalops cyprinoides]
MVKSKQYERDTECDERKKRKTRCSESMEACPQEENRCKKLKKHSKPEETPESVSLAKSQKKPPESEPIKVKNKKKSKKHLIEEHQVTEDTEVTQVEKKRKKKKKISNKEESEQNVSACTEQEQEEQDEGDLSPEERRVLERKMKKMRRKEEKRKPKEQGQSEEKAEASKPSAAQLALDYLTCWSETRKDWKFQKTRQTWLLQHMFDMEKVPEKSFPVLLTYLEGLRGVARDTTVQKAEALVREQEGKGEEDEEAQQRVQRAREVIQLLS